MPEIKLYDLDIEKSLLSILFVDPSLIVEVSLKIKSEDFYFQSHKIIFDTILKINEGKLESTLSEFSIRHHLENAKFLEEVGGYDYIVEISNYNILTSNVDEYVDIIIELSKKRKLIELSDSIKTEISKNIDIEDILQYFQMKLGNISSNNKTEGFITLSEVINSKINQIKEISENPDSKKLSIVKTALEDYDNYYNSLSSGKLIILAARPSVGKTALALNMALNALRNNKNVVFFSLEMSNEELLDRLISMESGIPYSYLSEYSFMDNSNYIKKYKETIGKFSKYNLILDASANTNILNITNTCINALSMYQKIDLVVIDYLQLISSGSKYSKESRNQEVSEISRSLKLLSKTLNAPILALSQLTRGVEHRTEKRPQLSDLRDSGSIEQDADQVLFLYSPDYHNAKKEEVGSQNKDKFKVRELIVSKNRSGKTGTMLLLFDGDHQRFLNPADEEKRRYFDSLNS